MNLSLWNILLYQNRGAKTKQLDEGIVDTFVLDDVLRSLPARALREIARRKKCYCFEPGSSPQLNLSGSQLVVGCMCFLGATDLCYGQSSNFGSSNHSVQYQGIPNTIV